MALFNSDSAEPLQTTLMQFRGEYFTRQSELKKLKDKIMTHVKLSYDDICRLNCCGGNLGNLIQDPLEMIDKIIERLNKIKELHLEATSMKDQLDTLEPLARIDLLQADVSDVELGAKLDVES